MVTPLCKNKFYEEPTNKRGATCNKNIWNNKTVWDAFLFLPCMFFSCSLQSFYLLRMINVNKKTLKYKSKFTVS